MITRSFAVVVDINDDISQDDEFEALMGEVENLIKSYTDPAIGRVRVVELS